MEKESIFVKLYGVITEIQSDGEISVCEPIFTDYFGEDKKFYRLITEDINPSDYPGLPGKPVSILKEIEEIDISEFGKPLFLPASRKKISDGKKYVIVFQPSKTGIIQTGIPTIFKIPEKLTKTDFIPISLNVGIKFPDKFILVKNSSKLSSEELKSLIENN